MAKRTSNAVLLSAMSALTVSEPMFVVGFASAIYESIVPV
jgi:hypothetical protein